MAGTVFAGVLAIVFGRLRMRIDKRIEEFVKVGNHVIGKARWFSVRSPLFFPRDQFDLGKLEDAMKDLVKRRSKEVPGCRADLFASPSEMCKTIVFASRRGHIHGSIKDEPWIFRSYDRYARQGDFLGLTLAPASSTEIWKVALATSAAPTYFKSHKIGIDKFYGPGYSNPTVDAMYEVDQCHKRFLGNPLDAIALVLSIGSGKVRRPSRSAATVFGKYYLSVKALERSIADTERTDHMVLTQQRGSKFAYTRLNVSRGLQDIGLYEWKTRSRLRKRTQTTLEHITKETTEYLRQEEVQKELRQVAEMLVENRRKRSTTPRWEAFSGSALVAKQEE